MDEYEGCEPENCPDCGSTKTVVWWRNVIPPNRLNQAVQCEECGNEWYELIDVSIEIKFRTPDEGGNKP